MKNIVFYLVLGFLLFNAQISICQTLEDGISAEDRQRINEISESKPAKSSHETYEEWAGESLNNYGPSQTPQVNVPRHNTTRNTHNGKANTIAEDMAKVNADADITNTTKYSVEGSSISNKYPVTFSGVDNDAIYRIADEAKKEELIRYGAGALLTILIIFLIYKYSKNFRANSSHNLESSIDEIPKASTIEIDQSLDTLQKLLELKEKGALSEVEYNDVKKKILNS